jgi:hypothetical protein
MAPRWILGLSLPKKYDFGLQSNCTQLLQHSPPSMEHAMAPRDMHHGLTQAGDRVHRPRFYHSKHKVNAFCSYV